MAFVAAFIVFRFLFLPAAAASCRACRPLLLAAPRSHAASAQPATWRLLRRRLLLRLRVPAARSRPRRAFYLPPPRVTQPSHG